MWWRRVKAREMGDGLDPVIKIIFGVGRKSPPEKFFGGGSEAAMVAGGGADGGCMADPGQILGVCWYSFESNVNMFGSEGGSAGERRRGHCGVV
ncbi:hypothetical protein Tco_1166913 [Tanacetum coccineum]